MLGDIFGNMLNQVDVYYAAWILNVI
jgi:hypothetical protein